MSLPKEPRQLMINLMYLVLTAMLALNVSSEILHAFKTINRSINQSNSSIAGKNAETLLAFEANEQMEGQYERVHPFYQKAKMIDSQATLVYNYLENWKERIIMEAGGYEDKATGEIRKEDDIDASTRLLVEKKGGDTIKNKLQALRDVMLSVVGDTVRNYISKQLPIQIVDPGKSDNNPRGDWATGNFYNMPTLAAVTLFAKMQNDVRNAEAMIMEQLFKEANAKQIKFDEIAAIAVPTTSYALQGQKVGAQIMLAAYNKSVNPSVSPNTGRIAKTEGGVAYWEGAAAGAGLQTVSGRLSFNLGDRTITKDWKFNYMVGTAGASLQLDKMNVFYIGVDNPVTVSAAGYTLEDVSLSIPGAQVSGARGKYVINVTQPGKVTASIMAKGQDGAVKSVGNMEIRVKMIPNPEARIAGKNGGVIPTNVFKAQQGIVAALDNFDFEARFQVTSFQVSTYSKAAGGDIIGPISVNSPLFSSNGQVTELIKRARPGDKFFFEEIRGVGPDKISRKLNNITITLQ